MLGEPYGPIMRTTVDLGITDACAENITRTYYLFRHPIAIKAEDERPPDGASKGISMMEKLPIVYIARHGNTAWTHSGQHTGLTDIPLTPDGERNAVRLGERLKGMTFAKVFTSPLQRASRTCELAGFGHGAETDADLVEWNYGKYEGLTFAQILQQQADWDLFRDGAPEGESPAQIGERADRVVQRIRSVDGDVLLFSSGHFIRVLTGCWLGVGPAGGRFFLLNPASLSAL